MTYVVHLKNELQHTFDRDGVYYDWIWFYILAPQGVVYFADRPDWFGYIQEDAIAIEGEGDDNFRDGLYFRKRPQWVKSNDGINWNLVTGAGANDAFYYYGLFDKHYELLEEYYVRFVFDVVLKA